MSAKQTEKLIERLGILVATRIQYMRKLTRMMLMNIGAKSIYEAADGLAAIDIIRTASPDVVLRRVGPAGAERAADHAHRALARRVHQAQHPRHHAQACAARARARGDAARRHEFLLKPTSPKALRDRLLSILIEPRPMVQIGKYYVPEPRRPLAQNEVRHVA